MSCPPTATAVNFDIESSELLDIVQLKNPSSSSIHGFFLRIMYMHESEFLWIQRCKCKHQIFFFQTWINIFNCINAQYC